MSNGEWTWPVKSIRTKPPRAVRGAAGSGSSSSSKRKSCPDCQYIAHVSPVTERFIATVVPTSSSDSSSSSSSSSSSHSEKTITKYKTKYITKYKTLYKERTVNVPVYDDPFWNPQADGRIAGEGIGLPVCHAPPFPPPLPPPIHCLCTARATLLLLMPLYYCRKHRRTALFRTERARGMSGDINATTCWMH